jgi:outer membrane protein
METYKETMDQIKQLNDELQNPGLSDSKRDDITKTREEKINEFKTLDREIQEFRAQKEKELQDEAIRRRNEIVADIMKLIDAKIKSDNYDYVFDKSGMSLNDVPVMIFARDSVDFSDEIIKALNSNRPRDTSTPAPSGSATPKPSNSLQP